MSRKGVRIMVRRIIEDVAEIGALAAFAGAVLLWAHAFGA
jgi:hypothetical protein